jgi:hypothetical protein
MSKRPAEDEEWLPNAKEKTVVTKKARSGNEGGAAQDKQSDALLKQIKSKSKCTMLCVNQVALTRAVVLTQGMPCTAMQAIKRVGHSGKNKPTSTVSFGIPSKSVT